MITIIHGDDIFSSRNKLNELTAEYNFLERFDAKKTKFPQIIDSLQSQELFTAGKNIVIDNISALPSSKIQILAKNTTRYNKGSLYNLFLWNEDILGKNVLTIFKNSQILLFALPKNFFLMLDSFAPSNEKLLHRLLFSLYPRFAAEQILFALIKRVRQLLMFQTGKPEAFGEIEQMQIWQKKKLSHQAFQWSHEKLILAYKSLLELEIKQKTSNLSNSLINHLDILFLTQL